MKNWKLKAGLPKLKTKLALDSLQEGAKPEVRQQVDDLKIPASSVALWPELGSCYDQRIKSIQ
ncbi:hypothetical protein [Synechococcus sp. WH 5701]|nr:hypothetical protein [Synechococcus sp. WH 5701]